MRSAAGSANAIVIGGGIIGLCSALELFRTGFNVTLIERDVLARQSSWAGGGMLSPLYPWQMPAPVWALVSESIASYPTLCAMLAEATGIDPEWTQCGLAVLDAEQFESGQRWAAQLGIVAKLGRFGSAPALRLPWAAQVRNPRLCKALAIYLRQQGVNLIEQAGEVRLQQQGSTVRVVSESEHWNTDVIVVAAGAWSAALLRSTDWLLPIAPVKGQMLMLRGAPGAIPEMLVQQGRYLIPRRDGRVLVGSTIEDAGFDVSTTDTARISLRSFADALVPACEQMSLEAHWAGLRPGSPEGIPIIARHHSINNLFVNAGHYRYGLTMALASAQRLRRLVTAN